MSWKEISAALDALRTLCPSPVPLTMETQETGLQMARWHGYHIFDALVIAAAVGAGCSTRYSENMHDRQVVEGLTIRNPFRRRAS